MAKDLENDSGSVENKVQEQVLTKKKNKSLKAMRKGVNNTR